MNRNSIRKTMETARLVLMQIGFVRHAEEILAGWRKTLSKKPEVESMYLNGKEAFNCHYCPGQQPAVVRHTVFVQDGRGEHSGYKRVERYTCETHFDRAVMELLTMLREARFLTSKDVVTPGHWQPIVRDASLDKLGRWTVSHLSLPERLLLAKANRQQR